MALTEIGGGGINYIQSSAPSSPEDKEIWIDVSSSPPLVKVYDADNSTWESATNVLSDGTRFDGANIDAAISSVGGVDWASKTPKWTDMTGSISGLDESSGTANLASVSGSGFIWYDSSVTIKMSNSGSYDNTDTDWELRLYTDGTQIRTTQSGTISGIQSGGSKSQTKDINEVIFIPFNSSFTLELWARDNNPDGVIDVTEDSTNEVSYLLD